MSNRTVPVLDLSPFYSDDEAAKLELAHSLDTVCRDVGFLVVTGHPVDMSLVGRVRHLCLDFFDLPEVEKMKIGRPRDDAVRGYIPVLSEGLSYGIGLDTPPDLKECVSLGAPGIPEARYLLNDPYYAAEAAGTHFYPNLWPTEPPEFRPILEEHFRVMTEFAFDLHRLFELALELPAGYFDHLIDKPCSTYRAIHYPPLTKDPEPGQLRAGEHSDYTNVTICTVSPGLQARDRSGVWIDVPVIENAFVINIGDLIMRWTNDRWMSTRHRVIAPALDSDANDRRLSLIYFFESNYDAMIECLPTCQSEDNPAKYPPIRAADYILEKYTKQTRFEKWSDETAAQFGTQDTESRFVDAG